MCLVVQVKEQPALWSSRGVSFAGDRLCYIRLKLTLQACTSPWDVAQQVKSAWDELLQPDQHQHGSVYSI